MIPSSTLCVRNVADNLTYNEILKEFGRYGSIKDIHIPLDFHSQKPKGYLFVEYEDSYQAEDAYYALNESKFYGNTIEIDFARLDWKRQLLLRDQQNFLKESCNIDEQKLMCIHVLNMSGI